MSSNNDRHILLMTAFSLILLAALKVEAQAVDQSAKMQRIQTIIDKQAKTAQITGHVYRLPATWVHYGFHNHMRNIFDGVFSKLDTDARYFRALFQSYVIGYSRACREYLPANSAVYTWKRRTQVFNGMHYKRQDYTTTLDQIIVSPDFQPTYQRYYDYWERDKAGAARGVAELIGKLLRSNLRDMHKIANQYNWVEAQALSDQSIFLRREGCDSPAQKQFSQNLLRAANGKASLQKLKTPVKGARGHSNLAANAKFPKSVAEACAINSLYRYKSYKFCKCIERSANRRMSASKRAQLIKNYSYPAISAIKGPCLN